MRRRINRIFLAASLLCGAAFLTNGCAVETDKAPVGSLDVGKMDGVEVVEQGPITFGEGASETLEPNIGHSWSFELSAEASVQFKTSAETSVDTVLYVQNEAGEEKAFNDDADGYFSAIDTVLAAGKYTVAVTGYDETSVGAFDLAAECTGDGCGEGVMPPPTDDPFALARDITLAKVYFDDMTPVPESYSRPDMSPSSISLSGPEWWQRWSGGYTQDFSWDHGTDLGKRCGQASAVRLESIWNSEAGNAALQRILDESGWRGTFYNWSEDISEGGSASGIAPRGGMWAWRTSGVKWINVTHPDGSCSLPTVQVVVDFANDCLEEGNSEIQGCRAYTDE